MEDNGLSTPGYVGANCHSRQVDTLADDLRRQRRAASARLATLSHAFDEMVAASRDSNADDEHDPEGTTIAFERSQLSALVAQNREQLVEIDNAIDRVRSGTYGICEHCVQPISTERLAARPVARLCIGCS